MAIGRAPALGEPRWDKLRRLYAEAKLARGQKGVEREWLRAVQEPVFVSMEASARMEAVSKVFRTTDGGPAVEAAPRVEAVKLSTANSAGGYLRELACRWMQGLSVSSSISSFGHPSNAARPGVEAFRSVLTRIETEEMFR